MLDLSAIVQQAQNGDSLNQTNLELIRRLFSQSYVNNNQSEMGSETSGLKMSSSIIGSTAEETVLKKGQL